MSELSETESRSHSPAPDSGPATKTLKFPNHRPSLAGFSLRSTQRKSKDAEMEDEEEEIKVTQSLSTRRKASGTRPLKISNSNFNKSDQSGKDGPPPPTSISISSISNFLHQKVTKISGTIPGVFRRRKSQDYKIQIFVSLMALTIILLVSSIYVIHKEKELQKAYFGRIRFSSKDRKIRISNLKGREVINGMLGTNLSSKDKAWQCLERDRRESEACLEWMNIARLYFRHTSPRKDWEQPNMQCYGILWESLNPDYVPMDCYNIGETKTGFFHYYGGGERKNNQWLLSRSLHIPLVPFITGSKRDKGNNETGEFEWGQNLKRYFIIYPGSSIEIPQHVPLHISVNDMENPGKICFAAKPDSFAYPGSIGNPNILNYTICTGENLYAVHNALSDKDIWNGLKHSDVHATQAFSEIPTWKILPETINKGNESETSLLNHTDRIAALLLSEGYLLLDESWQRRAGDWEIDSTRFSDIGETFNITGRRGFKVALTITPYVSTESINYVPGLEAGVWVMQKFSQAMKNSNMKVPALMNHKSSKSVVLLDITNPAGRKWLIDKVTKLVQTYSINGIYIDLGSSHDLPEHYVFSTPLASPDEYKHLFLSTVRNLNLIHIIGVNGAVKLPKLPTFVSLSATESSWEGLQSIIPNILTVGVAGFPFVNPGAIGGDYKRNYEKSEFIGNLTLFEYNKPERSLYIRWLELAHFLPAVQYTYLPSDYDQEVINIAKRLKLIREEKIYPSIKRAINKALTTGLPIVQPLWMMDPNDLTCLKISDQFMIGDEILVAPILNRNATEREIYLPKGLWKDQLSGGSTSTKGERWMHHYKVHMDQIPYFIKLSDPI